MSCVAGFENLRSLVKLEEFHNSLPKEVAGLAPVSIPAPKGFDAHSQFSGAFLPVFPQFQTPFLDLLPKRERAGRC
jgi:hypothetical protein